MLSSCSRLLRETNSPSDMEHPTGLYSGDCTPTSLEALTPRPLSRLFPLLRHRNGHLRRSPTPSLLISILQFSASGDGSDNGKGDEVWRDFMPNIRPG